MSGKSKIDPALKVDLVERYLRGEIGASEAARMAGSTRETVITDWVIIYRNEGPTGLLGHPHNKSYSKELKLAAVTDYLNGEGSLRDISLVRQSMNAASCVPVSYVLLFAACR